LNNMDMSMSGGNNGIGGAFYGLGVGDIGGNMSAVGTADYASNPLAPNKLSTPPNGEFGNFASFRRQKHRGQDFVAKTGTSIKAVRSGKVIKAGLEGDLGSMIRIQHPDGMRTVYGHLSSATVQEGTNVYGGQEIGLAGYSGGVYPKGPAGAHLHLALEDHSGQVHDPMPYLAGASNSVVNLGNNMSTASGVAASPASTSGVSMFGHLTGASMFSSGVGDSSGGPSYPSAGVNYGGVTVHINVPSGAAINETTLANEIKRVLRDEEQLKMAVSR
jgi:hypothetical protein